jgi:hypothetical protein
MHFVVLGVHSAEVCPNSNAVQWNTVRVLLSHPMEVGMKEIVGGTSLF